MIRQYGEEIELTTEILEEIVTLMDEEKREKVHDIVAPCSPIVFLAAYCNMCPEFRQELRDTFDIELL